MTDFLSAGLRFLSYLSFVSPIGFYSLHPEETINGGLAFYRELRPDMPKHPERPLQPPEKGWRAVFKSLSGKTSSDPRRHTEVPVHTYSAHKPLSGVKIKIKTECCANP